MTFHIYYSMISNTYRNNISKVVLTYYSMISSTYKHIKKVLHYPNLGKIENITTKYYN